MEARRKANIKIVQEEQTEEKQRCFASRLSMIISTFLKIKLNTPKYIKNAVK